MRASHPAVSGADDLPKLLRRLADEIERHGIAAMEILDLTVSQEMTGGRPVVVRQPVLVIR